VTKQINKTKYLANNSSAHRFIYVRENDSRSGEKRRESDLSAFTRP